MGSRISRGWDLLKQSWSVLRQDTELLLFPVISSLACLAVLASFAIPLLYFHGTPSDLFDEKAHPENQ